ncbi:DEAD/DEAH box helicase [Reichenbachiella agariperforans]|uniref:DEAD/DEAH box helicase n=1 Tax=Reichenbachiella agariperforans TaxID=156994 RepID=UPI0020902757|nr:DEAD/DEAH box helicase [Reichenbachiella agariperforans]
MNTFKELGLDEKILQALTELGISTPTEIQQEAIPFLLSSQADFIGLAQTGTGKTAAFGLPLLELTEEDTNVCQGIVLSPTRELAQQIAEGLKSFAKYSKKLKVACVYGGAPIMNQIKELKSKPQIVVATPGRLVDLINRKVLDVKHLRYLVLDEADEMLNMGFKEELDVILKSTPDEKTTWLFSATMPKAIRTMVKNYMHEPHEISVKSGVEVNKNIEHQYMVVRQSDKVEAIKRLVDMEPDIFGVLFCRTKIDTQKMADELSRVGYRAEALHGDLSQNQRDMVMKKFKERRVKLLIATDVAARGIDVNDVTHVIHHKLPDETEFYTHRSGRTARAGKKGISIAIVSKGEKRRLDQIQKSLGIEFERVMVPSGSEIANMRVDLWAQKLVEQNVDHTVTEELKAIVNKNLEGLSKEDLIDKLLTMELKNMHLNDNSDLNDMSVSKSDDRGESTGGRARSGFNNFTINIGKIDNIGKMDIMNIIIEVTGMQKGEVGNIDLQKKKTIVEIGKSESSSFTDKFKGFEFDDRAISVTEGGVAESSGQRRRPGGGRRDFRGGGGGFKGGGGHSRGGHGGGGSRSRGSRERRK